MAKNTVTKLAKSRGDADKDKGMKMLMIYMKFRYN